MNEQLTIEISPYDDRWPEIFRRERTVIAPVLADSVQRIDHVGSTSVPGLAAKPIVDIQAEVTVLGERSFYDATLRHLGYASIDSGENDLRVAMRKRAGIAANLHVVTAGSWAAQRTILFRDALRSDPELVRQYAVLKLDLARSHTDLDEYTIAKTAFIEGVIEAAAIASGLEFSPGNRR